MRVICGGDSGLIKVIDPQRQSVLFQMGEQGKDRSVEFLKWANPSSEAEIVVGYKTGEIEFYFPGTGQQRFSLTRSELTNIQGLYSENRGNNRNIITCNDEGLVEIFQFGLNNLAEQEEQSEEEEAEKEADAIKKPNTIKLKSSVTSFSVGLANVSVMEVVNLGNNKLELAVGGKGNLMKIFDVETQKVVYRAKNVPHDYLNLESPIWDNGITFLGKPDQINANLFCTRTAYHQIRFHDRRAKRAPITQRSIGDCTFTSLIASPKCDKEVLVGNAIGKMFRYNFENLQKKTLYSYKMMSGSVRDIQIHPSGEHVITSSTDRYVRVYDLEGSKKPLHSMYLVQRQNCSLVTSEGMNEIESDEDDDDQDEKDEKVQEPEEEEPVLDKKDPKNQVWIKLKKKAHEEKLDSDDEGDDDDDDDDEDDGDLDDDESDDD
ncbi:hypothetical protein AKO1_014210, partial [Acrasis kona]